VYIWRRRGRRRRELQPVAGPELSAAVGTFGLDPNFRDFLQL